MVINKLNWKRQMRVVGRNEGRAIVPFTNIAEALEFVVLEERHPGIILIIGVDAAMYRFAGGFTDNKLVPFGAVPPSDPDPAGLKITQQMYDFLVALMQQGNTV